MISVNIKQTPTPRKDEWDPSQIDDADNFNEDEKIKELSILQQKSDIKTGNEIEINISVVYKTQQIIQSESKPYSIVFNFI